MNAIEISPETRELLEEEQRRKHDEPVRYLNGQRRDTVTCWGIEFDCTYEYTEGESAIHWGDFPHPGSPAYVSLIECFHKGEDIMEMLTSDQVERLEEKLMEGMEA